MPTAWVPSGHSGPKYLTESRRPEFYLLRAPLTVSPQEGRAPSLGPSFSFVKSQGFTPPA